MRFFKDEKRIQIAVVDDDPLDIEILDAYLNQIKAFEFSLHPFHEWKAAENNLSSMDLLILDYYLGSDTALTILKNLRKTGNEIPIIVLTGNRDSHTAARIIKYGADDYLNKGELNSDELRKSISNILKMSHLKQEQKALQTKMQTLQRMEAMGTMASGIAHDFNNILSPIMGHAEMLLMDAQDNENLTGGLNEILSAARRAKELVHQILTFSRQGVQEKGPLQMYTVVDEAAKLMQATLPSTIKVRINLQKESDLIIADPTKIHQVVMNLMTNAYHAMEKTGGELMITLASEILPRMLISGESIMPGKYMHLCVADTGEGIPPELIDRVFDPYMTTKKEGKGTGLGMAVVHGIVKSCHGYIAIESQRTKGTSVHIHIPILKEDRNEIRSDHPLGHQYYKGTGRILLVDDEAPIILMERKMLERMGYHVTAINSSLEALNRFKEHPYNYDLIITDYTMPEMNGIQLAKAIMAIRPDIPVLLFTGYSEQITLEAVKKIGIRELVMKPVDQSQLSLILYKTMDSPL